MKVYLTKCGLSEQPSDGRNIVLNLKKKQDVFVSEDGYFGLYGGEFFLTLKAYQSCYAESKTEFSDIVDYLLSHKEYGNGVVSLATMQKLL